MNTKDNKVNFITRCPECILIPSIKLKFDSNEIEYQCENKHHNSLKYDKFINESKKHSLNNIQCSKCNNKKSDDLSFFYCFKCKNFICGNCINEHKKNNKEHIQFPIENYDGCCKEHNNSYSDYCKDCRKNICSICQKNHLTHNILDLSNIIFDEKDEIINEINKIKDINNKINEIQNKINELFNKIKNNISNKVDFVNSLLYTYQYQQKYNNLNYYAINNLKLDKNYYIKNEYSR